MVFISLEGFVGSTKQHQQHQVPISRMHQVATNVDASVHVVVTPGSPTKKHANASLVAARARFSFRSQRASSTPFLLYVTDSAASTKWVLTKSAAEYHAFRTLVQQAIGSCQQFSCCGPLRRIAKSPLYKSARTKWSDSSVTSQYGLAGVVQEHVNDLVLAVFAREHQCESTASAHRVLSQFLDIPAHRAAAADSLLHAAAARSSQHVHAPGAPVACRSRNGSDPVASSSSSHSDAECPICCADLGCDATLALPCSHSYHVACVRVWFTMQHTCPVCRVAVDANVAA